MKSALGFFLKTEQEASEAFDNKFQAMKLN